MDGKLFVIEGTDGSGKSTQLELTCRALEERGVHFRSVRFPRYDKKSSALLRMYLDGEFGKNPGDVNAYAASTFFSVDRYASFKSDWGDDYRKGGVFLMDRYTTSNAVHQASKLEGIERSDFLNWLFDYEYRLLGLPKPHSVLFLDMPTEFSVKLLDVRQGENGDIHELDHEYLSHCRENALDICEKYGWHRIPCTEKDKIRTLQEINTDICEIIFKELKLL